MIKKLLCIVVFACIIIGAMGQDKAIADKETTAFFITVEGDAKENYKLFGNLILENEFIIEKSDPEFLTIYTQPKQLKVHPNWSHTWYCNIRFKENQIIIQPYWKSNIEISMYGVKSVDTPFQWHYTKNKSDLKNLIYCEIMELLTKYPNLGITYN